MTSSDTGHFAALQAIYRLVEQGLAPNGTQPEECGEHQELIQELYDEYQSVLRTTQLLVEAGRSTDDPHHAAILNIRSLWAAHVRAPMTHELRLIEEMRRIVTSSLERPRLGLVEIVDALQAAKDAGARRNLALDLVEDASILTPADLVRLADTLKTAFQIPVGWIREWKKAVLSAAKERRQRAAELIPAAESEANEDQKATWPYLVVGERMIFCAQRADMFGGASVAQVPIADFNAKIIEEQCGEDGRKNFLIEGETLAHRPFQLTMEAEEFADDKRLKAALTAAAGAQAPIYVGMSKHLAAAIQRLSGDIPSVKRYTRTGWADGVFLLPGRTIEGVTVQLGRKLPYSVSGDAQIEQGLEALEALLLSHTPERGGPALSFLLTPPLALLAGWRNERYGLFIAGRTGSLKSSWSQAAMCMYGPGFIRDDLLVKWGQGATNNALMAMAVAAYDLPFLIDNYKPNTGEGPKAFINLIHNIVEGGEKDRLNRSSELRDSRPVFAWPVVTGEDVPDHDPASLARVLVLPFVRPDEATEHLAKAQRLSQHLCAIGRAWIEWIEGEVGRVIIVQAAERFEQTRREWSSYLLAERPDMVNVLRIASNLTTNELTWAIAEQHPLIGPLIQRYGERYYEGLTLIGRGMASYTAESLEAARFIEMLRDLLTTEQAILIEQNTTPGLNADRMIGWKADDGGAWLLMKPAQALMKRRFGEKCLNEISEMTLYSQLKDLGFLVPGKDKATHQRWMNGKNNRVVILTRIAIEGGERGDSAS
jgi:hypothetical protein